MKRGIQRIEGRAIALGSANIDTDTVIPAQFLKTVSRTGLGRHAFAALRADPGNIFDDPSTRGVNILIAGENFGCGSSREHAVWALLDFGIRAVIATGFSDIFAGNAFKNGLVAARIESQWLLPLLEAARDQDLCVDLADLTVIFGDAQRISFELDPFQRECLLQGLDEIDLTLTLDAKIASYEICSLLLGLNPPPVI